MPFDLAEANRLLTDPVFQPPTTAWPADAWVRTGSGEGIRWNHEIHRFERALRTPTYPTPRAADPNDVSYQIWGDHIAPTTLVELVNNTHFGNGRLDGTFQLNQYVLLGNGSKAYYKNHLWIEGVSPAAPVNTSTPVPTRLANYHLHPTTGVKGDWEVIPPFPGGVYEIVLEDEVAEPPPVEEPVSTITCDEFARTDLGSTWSTGPIYKGTDDTVIVNRIEDSSFVTDDSDSQPGQIVYGSVRTTALTPATDTQSVEVTVGNVFQGATPGMSDDFQIMESEWYLFTQVQDTPTQASSASGLNACIGLFIMIQMNSQDPDHDGSVYLELFTVGPDGDYHFDYADSYYNQDHPDPAYTENGDYVIRLETDPDGACRAYLNDALVLTDLLPTTGGTHVGIGSYWYTTNYDGNGATRNPTPPKARSVCYSEATESAALGRPATWGYGKWGEDRWQ